MSEPENKFTPNAEHVLALARKESGRLKHNFVGTEHLLIGLVKLGRGNACSILVECGLDLETIRAEVEKIVASGTDLPRPPNPPYTPRVLRIFKLAAREALNLKHDFTGTEHLLLGILREGEGTAARVLRDLKLNLEDVRQKLLKKLGGKTPTESQSETSIPRPSSRILLRLLVTDFLAINLNPEVLPKDVILGFTQFQIAILTELANPILNLQITKCDDLTLNILDLVSETTELPLIKAAAPALIRLNGNSGAAVLRIEMAFEKTETGSRAEKNLGALLQLLTKKTLIGRTVEKDFLGELEGENSKEKE